MFCFFFIIFMSFISILYVILLDDDFWKILLIITGLLNIINIKKKWLYILNLFFFSISYFLSALICDIYVYKQQSDIFYTKLTKLTKLEVFTN